MAVSGGVLHEHEWALLRLLQQAAHADEAGSPNPPVVAAVDHHLANRVPLERRNIRGARKPPVSFEPGAFEKDGRLPREPNGPRTQLEVRTAWTVDGQRPTEEGIIGPPPSESRGARLRGLLDAAVREIAEAGNVEADLVDLRMLEEAASIRGRGHVLPPALRARVFAAFEARRRRKDDMRRRASRDGSEMPFCHPSAALAQAASAALAESVREEYERRIWEAVKGLNPERTLNAEQKTSLVIRDLGYLRESDLRQLAAVPEPDPKSADHASQLQQWLPRYRAAAATGRGVVVDLNAPDLRRLVRAILERVIRLATVEGIAMKVLECGTAASDEAIADAACKGLFPVRQESRTVGCSDACREAMARARRAQR